jgi:hypothetical protein
MDMIGQTIFQTVVVVLGALLTSACALLYFRRVRLERPPLGVFNPRDIGMVLIFILALPFLYLILPSPVLTGILVVTFVSALYLALRPFLPPRYLWPLLAVLMVANILITENLLGTRQGWQAYWVLTSAIVLIASVGVANLYVQGGMNLKHIAWFALILAFYDGFFNLVVPISQKLADRFEGQPLDPSIGFTVGPYSANIGLGDLLVFSLFTIAAYKGFGKRGAIASFIIIGIFGALMPATSPLILTVFIRQNIGIAVPAQAFFGPAALVTYWLLSRRSAERSMGQWISEQDAKGHEPIRVVRRNQPRPVATRSIQPVPDVEVVAKSAG